MSSQNSTKPIGDLVPDALEEIKRRARKAEAQRAMGITDEELK